MIAREGNRVMGAIFPTGRCVGRPWRSGRASQSVCRRPDGPCLAIAECYFIGREDEGRSSAARGAHALPWGSRSRLRPSHWGSVSLALLMPETWFGTCLTLPDFQAKPCHGKWSFLLVLKFRRSRANAGRHSECSKSVRGLVGLKSTNFGIAPFLYMRFLCCVELKDEESIRWVL